MVEDYGKDIELTVGEVRVEAADNASRIPMLI